MPQNRNFLNIGIGIKHFTLLTDFKDFTLYRQLLPFWVRKALWHREKTSFSLPFFTFRVVAVLLKLLRVENLNYQINKPQ